MSSWWILLLLAAHATQSIPCGFEPAVYYVPNSVRRYTSRITDPCSVTDMMDQTACPFIRNSTEWALQLLERRTEFEQQTRRNANRMLEHTIDDGRLIWTEGTQLYHHSRYYPGIGVTEWIVTVVGKRRPVQLVRCGSDPPRTYMELDDGTVWFEPVEDHWKWKRMYGISWRPDDAEDHTFEWGSVFNFRESCLQRVDIEGSDGSFLIGPYRITPTGNWYGFNMTDTRTDSKPPPPREIRTTPQIVQFVIMVVCVVIGVGLLALDLAPPMAVSGAVIGVVLLALDVDRYIIARIASIYTRNYSMCV